MQEMDSYAHLAGWRHGFDEVHLAGDVGRVLREQVGGRRVPDPLRQVAAATDGPHRLLPPAFDQVPRRRYR